MRWDAIVVGAALAGVLAWRTRRDQVQARAWRTSLFDDCGSLLGRAVVRQDRAGWPLLEGDLAGLPVTLSLIFDDAGYRKLPVLWLSATVTAPLRVTGAFDALAREQGTEFFSPANELPVRLALPPGWSGHVSLRADRAVPMPGPLADFGTRYFAAPDAKEIVVSPRGLRLVRRVAESRRADYLVLRRARFEFERIDAGVVAAHLAELRELAQALDTSTSGAARHAA